MVQEGAPREVGQDAPGGKAAPRWVQGASVGKDAPQGAWRVAPVEEDAPQGRHLKKCQLHKVLEVC